MNRDWMRDQLEEFAQLCAMRVSNRPPERLSTRRPGTDL